MTDAAIIEACTEGIRTDQLFDRGGQEAINRAFELGAAVDGFRNIETPHSKLGATEKRRFTWRGFLKMKEYERFPGFNIGD